MTTKQTNQNKQTTNKDSQISIGNKPNTINNKTNNKTNNKQWMSHQNMNKSSKTCFESTSEGLFTKVQNHENKQTTTNSSS